MALAQELSSTAAVEHEEPTAIRAAVPARSLRTARAKRGNGTEPEGKLARTVAQLRALENGIVTRLAAAERLLAGLVSRRVHEDAGYGSGGEFEQRVLAAAPLLRAMREAHPARVRAPRPSAARRESGDLRARGLKALSTVARALDRVRALDEELGRLAAEARQQLGAVEALRLFEECGYSSFEEFLERALGPSPVLSFAVSLVGLEPTGHEDLPSGPSPVGARASVAHDFPAALLGETYGEPRQEASLGAPDAPPLEPETFGGEDGEETSAVVVARSARRSLARSVFFCLMATVLGASAGAWTELAALTRRAPDPPLCVAAASTRSAPADRLDKTASRQRPSDLPRSKGSAQTAPGGQGPTTTTR